jgi:hypothetical protein
MKQIQPISIWYNGQMVPATIFNMTSISDNLSTQASFYYQLLSGSTSKLDDGSMNIQLAEGNLIMDGFDYEAYSTSPDSNDYAYQWGAGKLNLTLV